MLKNIKKNNEFKFLDKYIEVEKSISILNNDIQKGILPTSFMLNNLLKEFVKLEKQINKEESNIKIEIQETIDERNKKVLELSLERLRMYKEKIPSLKKKLDLFLTLVTNKDSIDKNEINNIISIYDMDADNKIDLDEIQKLEKNINFLGTFKDNDIFKGFFEKNKIEFNNKEISELVTFFKKKRNLLQYIEYLKEYYLSLRRYINKIKNNNITYFEDTDVLSYLDNLKIKLKKSITKYLTNKDDDIEQQLTKIHKKLSLINDFMNKIEELEDLIKKLRKKSENLLDYSLKNKYSYYIKKTQEYDNFLSSIDKINEYKMGKLNNKINAIQKDIDDIEYIIEKEKKKKEKREKLIKEIENYKKNIKNYSNYVNIDPETSSLLTLTGGVLLGWGLSKLIDLKDNLKSKADEMEDKAIYKIKETSQAVTDIIGSSSSENSWYNDDDNDDIFSRDSSSWGGSDSRSSGGSSSRDSSDNGFDWGSSFDSSDSDMFDDFTSSGEDSR